MIGPIHREFTKTLIEKTSNISSMLAYVAWSVSPDEDMFDYHRYKYHRISQFSKLYDLYIQKYDMRNALDKKLAYYIMLQHDYLDVLGGPVAVFNGLNITCNKNLLELLNNKGYKHTIRKIYSLITEPTTEFKTSVFTEFKKLNVSDIDTVTLAMAMRLIESTVGVYSLDDMYPILDRIRKVDQIDYEYVYCQCIKMEDNIIKSIETII